LPYRNCTPPWCETQIIAAQIRAVSIELAKAEPNLATVKKIYLTVGATFKDIIGARVRVQSETRATTYRQFGDFLAEISTNPLTSSSPSFNDAGLFALQAYANAQKINETPETYQKMQMLWENYSRDDLAFKTGNLKQCAAKIGQTPTCDDSAGRSKALVLRDAWLAPTSLMKIGGGPFEK